MLRKINTLALVCLFFTFSTNALLAQVVANAGVNQSICSGSNATIGGTPTATGGTPPYTYNWSPVTGLSSSVISNPVASPDSTTTYTVTVTDANSTTATASIAVNVIAGPEISISSPVILTCTTTSEVLTASSTTPGATYGWSTGANTATTTVSSPNIYTVTVTNPANGCTASSSVEVYEDIGIPNVSIATPVPLNCITASETLTASSTVNGAAFNWGGGVTTPTNIITSPGNYTVTVTSPVDGCTASASVTVVQNISHPQDSLSVTNVTCSGGSNGAICAYASNGVPPYEYNWSNGAIGQCIGGLAADSYGVTISDANGCSVSAAATVLQPQPTGISFTTQNITCNGGSNGSVTITVTGGTPPYEWVWSNGLQNIAVLTSLSAGVYGITLTDAHGCSVTDSVSVGEPAVALHDSIAVTNVSCFNESNGSLCDYATGGTPPYNYLWSNSATTQCMNSLPSGTWTTTVTDANLCTVSNSATITQPSAIVINYTSVINVSCNGGSNGSLCAYVAGGTTPYNYEWSNGATPVCITGLTAGLYSVTATDVNGCSASGSVPVTQPAALLISQFNTTGTGVIPDTVNFRVEGGTSPYGINWGNGQTGSTDSTARYIYSAAGVDTIVITDANGCTTSRNVDVDTIIPLIANAGNNVTACLYSDNITLGGNPTASGGNPPYSYAWSDGLPATANPVAAPSVTHTYTLTVTDANSASATSGITITVGPGLNAAFSVPAVCPGSPSTFTDQSTPSGSIISWAWNFNDGSTSTVQNPNHTFATAGTYPVTLTVSNGICNADTTINVTINNAPTSTFTATSPVCEGQNAIITYTGNAGAGATYTWNFIGGTIASGTGQGPYAVNWSTGGVQNVTLSVTDGACTSTITTQSVLVNPLPVLTVSGNTSVSCGGSVTLTASGASTYTWAPAVGLNSTTLASVIASPANTTTYIVTGSSFGCSASDTVTVTVTGGLQIDSIVPTNVSCFNTATGSVCAYATGGPFTYQWSNGATTMCNSSLGIGDYYVTVSHANGCSATAAAVITQPAQLTLQVLTPDTNAIPDTVSFTVAGGSPSYLYNWDNGQTTSTGLFIYTTAGIYTDTITDANGCILTYVVDAACTDQCVWPGDANYDGVVNNNDLLAIGVGYDTTGPARTNPTINFIPQYCALWADTLIGGVNYKHLDCNGDGIINASDTSAIVLNYSLTHVRGARSGGWKDDEPGLYIALNPDTVTDGEILTATLSLGNQAMPVTNAYAIAFTYNFDPLVVDSTDVSISFGNSWLFSAGNHINISKAFYNQGQIQAAITRINHVSLTGNGPIATVSMKITTGNINGKNLQYYAMNNFISNLTVIDNNGRVIPVNAGTDSAQVAFVPTNVIQVKNADEQIQIFPNPASDQLNIISAQSDIQEIRIFDMAGQQVIYQNTQAGNYSVINVSELSAGVYMIKLKTAGQEFHSRFVKVGAK